VLSPLSATRESVQLQAKASVHVADWSVLRLFNQYRLLMLMALAAVFYIAEDQRALGSRNSELFITIHLGYLVSALLFVYLIRLRRPSAQSQFFLQCYVDILAISGLMYTSGGINSGLGPLLLINLALLSQMTAARYALLFAAIATSAVLGEELLARFLLGASSADFQSTALLGTLLFLTAWVFAVPMRRLTSRQITEATHSRVGLDVKQIAHLNEEIIRELDSGVVVIDEGGEVQLINDTARTLLNAEFTSIPIPISRLCNDLSNHLRESEYSPTLGTRPFELSGTNQAILPQYIPLSTGGMLIKLDDHAHIRQQYQQLKLASLGRLSASIAHEIRNPLGAISHAVQLVQESPTIDDKDLELLGIAKRHTTRINRIVEDVLQLSNRQRVRLDTINLQQAIADFRDRFQAENSLAAKAIECDVEPGVHALFDAEHLDQVLWNLCSNARLHNDDVELTITIKCWQAHNGTVVIDVMDDGNGISDIDRENLFEPFYSTHHAGTGLGLFIIRELCDLNKAHIECLKQDVGAHFRIILSNAQEMAA